MAQIAGYRIKTWRSSSLKTYRLYISLGALLVLVLASCGYHNPNIYSGPKKVIYLQNWKNRTSELGLDSSMYRSLVGWYQNSGAISITKSKEGAHLMLAGEIVSISLPSLSYGSGNSTTEVKIRLKVRYVMKDLTTDTILFEQPGEIWSQNYLTAGSTANTKANQRQALEIIVDDLSEKIYQKTVARMQTL